ncbi:type II secretion system F family protein [Candidatus Parcubacteria bacterium]|nr:MAG: type II secretion system F family protein [Candidatus Parcubacteria bacterium]
MSLFKYTAIDADGAQRQGTIDAVNIDVAIAALQRRNLVVSDIDSVEAKTTLFTRISFFDRITNSDVVMISRQMTTLFEAQVSALRAFRLLAAEARTPKLAEKLSEIANDIQSGSAISAALARHPDVFSPFYVNMVRAGEESGKLDETFTFLSDYLDRNYEIAQKAKNALIYPAFIMFTFFVVMGIMLTVVIPNLATILTEAGQAIPVYTRVVIALSNFLTHYALLLGALLLVGGVFLFRYGKTEAGKQLFSRARIQIPVIGGIYQKLFLSRIADNLSTMLNSGIQMLRSLEITALVVGDKTYEKIIATASSDVKAGLPVSEALRKHPEIPGIMIAMLKIGEETGNTGHVLDTMAKFYRREVNHAVDTLVSLIEPFMIVTLAVGVGILLASVLIPIYNIASGF